MTREDAEECTADTGKPARVSAVVWEATVKQQTQAALEDVLADVSLESWKCRSKPSC
jgi:hypothetical protein